MSCKGSTFKTERSTSSQSRCSIVCRTEHRNTWSNAVFRSPTSPLVNIYAPPVDVTGLCRATDGPSLLGPTTRNALPDDLPDQSHSVGECYRQHCSPESARLRCCMKSRYINLPLTLTFFADGVLHPHSVVRHLRSYHTVPCRGPSITFC